MRTILGNEINIEGKDYSEEAVKKANEAFENAIKREADLIVTAVVMGFIGTRYHLNQPCQFDYEYPSPKKLKEWEPFLRGAEDDNFPDDYKNFVKEIQQFLHAMSAMSLVLDKNEPGLGNWLEDGQSFGWNPGALITGLAGGQMNSAAMRHRALKSAMTNDLAEKIATNPASFTGAETLYLGKGAYTGIIDDVVNNTRFVQRTKRVIDNDKKRWHPGDANWGLIKAVGNENINLEELKRGGLGPLPAERRELKAPARICYIHGMVSAIVKSVSVGPWCAPYELATGTETTKMASCFACTTYMYATGFPPSSTHLGRGESWIPPKPELESGEQIEGIQEYFNKFDKTVMSSLNTRWHWDIYHYLRMGTNYLQNAKCLNDDYAGIANKLASILQGYKSEDIGQQGGNLYLDALTVHESDWRRIMRTLQPIYDEFANTVV